MSLWNWFQEHFGGHSAGTPITPSHVPAHPVYTPPAGPDPQAMEALQSQQALGTDLHQIGDGINALSVQYHQTLTQLEQIRERVIHLETLVIIGFAVILLFQCVQLVIILRQGAPKKARR